MKNKIQEINESLNNLLSPYRGKTLEEKFENLYTIEGVETSMDFPILAQAQYLLGKKEAYKEIEQAKNKNKLESLDEWARYIRRWYYDDLKEYMNDMGYEVTKPEYEDKVEKMLDQEEADSLEDSNTDYMFNMEDIIHCLQQYDYESQGCKDEMIWWGAYNQALQDNLEVEPKGKEVN